MSRFDRLVERAAQRKQAVRAKHEKAMLLDRLMSRNVGLEQAYYELNEWAEKERLAGKRGKR